MNNTGASMDMGFAQEKLYAAAKQTFRNTANDPDMENSSDVSWQAVDGKDGKIDYGIRCDDAVYMSMIAGTMTEDQVESLDGKKNLKFREKATKALEEKMLKLGMDVYSHNYFMAELAKMGVGIIGFQLSVLGVDPARIKDLLAEAKKKKIEMIDLGVKQLVSEKMLFGIVTGARMS
ncbi:MAG: hypothetical protein ABIH50_06645 [bacterium]